MLKKYAVTVVHRIEVTRQIEVEERSAARAERRVRRQIDDLVTDSFGIVLPHPWDITDESTTLISEA